MATSDYYRMQAETCLHMSRVCPDPVLAERLDGLATAFLEAAADQATQPSSGNALDMRKQARG